MEPKPAGIMAACPMNNQSHAAPSMFSVIGGGDFARISSELDLEEYFVNEAVIVPEITNGSVNDEDVKPGEFPCQSDRGLAETDAFIDGDCSDDLHAAFRNTDTVSGFSACSELADTIFCSQNVVPNPPTISATIDSQSSICCTVGSPVSANKPNPRDNQAKGASSGSSRDQSEDDETGPCEQSVAPVAKRDRRKECNRESAKRSRRRKQAQLSDLELQVEQLRVENATLYKQLSGAGQQFREADINNRVLKSDVEALRANVKLAEDIVARGSLTTLNNQVLQTQSHHLTPPPQLNTSSLRGWLANASPTINVRGNDASYAAMTFVAQNSALGPTNLDVTNRNFNAGVISDTVNCVTDDHMWAP